ncbi:hypothetical protein ACFJIY_25030 [Pimelobacter simplex]|uniref:hypothetical protein n=1 Tax=Nocardioides simplex TaxID=2045 RepID=UPI00366F592F
MSTLPPILAVRPDARPEIVCPRWCSMTYEHHLGELGELEGFVIHHSQPIGGVSHSSHTYPDNTPHDEPRIYMEAQPGITVAQGKELARSLLAVIEEASR